jgi:hypothetical protein
MHPAVHAPTEPPPLGEPSLRSISRLFPYLWEFRGRVLFAMALVLFAVTFVVNLAADWVLERQRRRWRR